MREANGGASVACFPGEMTRQREPRSDSWYGEIGHQQPAFGGCRWQVPARMFDAPGRGAHRALTGDATKLIVAATVGKFDATCLGSKNRTPLTWISVWSRVR